MLKIALLLNALGFVLCVTVTASIRIHLDGRIVGGNLTTISLFPWQVSVQIFGIHSCGASIYNEKIIITAAHCVHIAPIKEVRIRAGSSFLNSGGVIIPAVNIMIHEDFEPITIQNDIAIIRLEFPLKFGFTIKPIPLSTVAPRNGATAIISGWGKTNATANTISTVLQYAHASVIDMNRCRSPNYGYGKDIYPSMICAAAPGKDACQMDSGGPMVSNGQLVGIISWALGCADPKYPGVYTNVALMRSWIEEAAKTV